MNTQEPISQLQQFREELYHLVDHRPDALMDLLDALASTPDARSVVELSLSPLFRRGYSSISDAIDGWFRASAPGKADELLRKRMTADDYEHPLTDSATLRDIRGSVFLDELFRDFFKEFRLHNPMPKREFYQIAAEMKPEEIHPEVIAVLDAVAEVLKGQTLPENGNG